MADAYTGTGSLDYDQAAYNRALYFAFREENVFDQLATVGTENVTNPGATVTFFKQLDLAKATTTLSEAVDVDAVALDSDTVVVTLEEKGNAVITTQKLRLTTMIPLNTAITNVLGSNAAESMNAIALAGLLDSTGLNVDYSGAATSRATIDTAHVLTSADIRYARNRLRRAKVPKRNGRYAAIIHPDTLLDLRIETGGLGWHTAMAGGSESGIQKLYTDEIGMYEGFSFIETTDLEPITDAGAAAVDAYQTVFLGDRALAKGHSNAEGYGPNPITVKSPVVDKLQRFEGWGWKHFVGYKRFENAAVFVVESSSSVGANA